MALSEHEIIERYFAPLAGREGLGLIDDAALLVPEHGFDLIVTTDLVAEGIHFFSDDPPAAIAAKALRVNLSDLAAKGAEPVAYTLALALGETADKSWIAEFAEGLAVDQARYIIHLVGGDTSRAKGGTVVTITAFGRVPIGTMVRRDGAQPGDVVLVSGTLGDAALGLRYLRREIEAAEPDHLVHRFHYPEPRTDLAPLLPRYANAAMDISDGLAGDLAKLCRASGVSALVAVDELPLSDAARSVRGGESFLQETALTGGDDYEILAAVAPDKVADVIAAAREADVALTPIGEIIEGGDPPRFHDRFGDLVRFRDGSFDHFGRPGG